MMPEQRSVIEALARDIAEHRTGMPAYLVDDETWGAALAEAEATYVQPEPESPIAAACRRARGDLRGEEVVQAIEAYNRGALHVGRNVELTDNGDGTYSAVLR